MKATTKAMAILLALAVVPVYADRDGTVTGCHRDLHPDGEQGS